MKVVNFIHETDWKNLPQEVRSQARRCLLDTLGAAISGRQTVLSQIIHDFAASNFGGPHAELWLDGRSVSPPGAALANGMTIDALDIHDGHPLAKGHAGAAIVPGVFATIPAKSKKITTGVECLTTLVIGYEIALRSGIALHATAPDYHTSGAWNALGCAALTARCLGLSAENTRHALGIAEYHGPRSQMMRCIDYPTMVKDGSGWGAMAGVSAAIMAQDKFTGAPAFTVESKEVGDIWSDLGSIWQITTQYFKPHAVCRWAQPAVEGALALQNTHHIEPQNIRRLKVFTFHEAVRLACRHPQTTEEAQYSLPFPIAAALVFGRLGAEAVSGDVLVDPLVLQISECVEMTEDETFNTRFPAERFARVVIETKDGDILDSGEVEANWDATSPPTDTELREKFRWLTNTQLSPKRTVELENMIWYCADLSDISDLVRLLTEPA
jgi:2-methylcitrate dehydratase PrpD